MATIVLGISAECDGAEQAPEHDNALECGYIDEGSASAPIGVSWYDTSKGTTYGGGHRYDCEETAYMAKVPSKNR